MMDSSNTKTIIKGIREAITTKLEIDDETKELNQMTKKEKEKVLKDLNKEMRSAAGKLDFERAAELRDIIIEIKGTL